MHAGLITGRHYIHHSNVQFSSGERVWTYGHSYVVEAAIRVTFRIKFLGMRLTHDAANWNSDSVFVVLKLE